MTIILAPELETAVAQEARRDGKTPESLVIEAVQERINRRNRQRDQEHSELTPRDDWERLVLGIGSDAGVSLTDEQLSREVMYEDRN